MIKKGKVILISGPSGVGKKTIIDKLRENEELNLSVSISMTTRQKRNNEIDGVDYHFKTNEEFLSAINNDELLEYEEFCGNYYGTPKSHVEKMLLDGKNVILEIEVKGAKKILSKFNKDEIISIFIAPPSVDELFSRLLKRNTENIDIIKKRIETAKIEINEKQNYEFIVINDQLDNAINKITDIINLRKN